MNAGAPGRPDSVASLAYLRALNGRDQKTLMEELRPGQQIVYHRGYLARDRVGNPSVHDLARLAGRLAGRRGFELYQIRHGESDASYILRRPARRGAV